MTACSGGQVMQILLKRDTEMGFHYKRNRKSLKRIKQGSGNPFPQNEVL